MKHSKISKIHQRPAARSVHTAAVRPQEPQLTLTRLSIPDSTWWDYLQVHVSNVPDCIRKNP